MKLFVTALVIFLRVSESVEFTPEVADFLSRSRRMSAADICHHHQDVVQPADFIKNQLCGYPVMRELMRSVVCDESDTDCFSCDTDSVEFEHDEPIYTSRCEVRKELSGAMDHHSARNLCYGLAREAAWNMCVSEEEFNLFYCPAVTFLMGKQATKQTFVICNVVRVSVFSLFGMIFVYC